MDKSTGSFREYENGVADVLASVVGEVGTVQRNVKLPSRSGGRRRQIDVLVEGNIFGLTNASLIVDCKRWKQAIDIADVERFIGLVEDVGADMGMLVSAAGASDGAMNRAADDLVACALKLSINRRAELLATCRNRLQGGRGPTG